MGRQGLSETYDGVPASEIRTFIVKFILNGEEKTMKVVAASLNDAQKQVRAQYPQARFG